MMLLQFFTEKGHGCLSIITTDLQDKLFMLLWIAEAQTNSYLHGTVLSYAHLKLLPLPHLQPCIKKLYRKDLMTVCEIYITQLGALQFLQAMKN
jgi:hypothetical protein